MDTVAKLFLGAQPEHVCSVYFSVANEFSNSIRYALGFFNTHTSPWRRFSELLRLSSKKDMLSWKATNHQGASS